MVAEYSVLQAGGETWRQAVRQLKKKGPKTEPVSVMLLHLPGNPYEALLTLAGKSLEELRALVANLPSPLDVV